MSTHIARCPFCGEKVATLDGDQITWRTGTTRNRGGTTKRPSGTVRSSWNITDPEFRFMADYPVGCVCGQSFPCGQVVARLQQAKDNHQRSTRLLKSSSRL